MELSVEKFINAKELSKLMKSVSRLDTPAAQVDYALFQLLSLTGLRISEALNLKWSDVCEGYIVIRKEVSKNGKRQSVHLGTKATALLESFRESNPYAHSPYIFNSQKGRLQRTSAHDRLKAHLRANKLRDTISLHSFRHSWALSALEAGISLALIRDNLRHSNISITSAYLSFTKDNLQKLKDAF